MLYFRVNENKRVSQVFTSDSETEYDAIVLTKELNPADRNIMSALYLKGKLIFDEEYEEAHKPPKLPNPPFDKNQIIFLIQKKLDQQAREYDFDNIFTASTYLNSAVGKFKADAIALVAWRDHVWDWTYQYIEQIEKRSTESPTTEEELYSIVPEFDPPPT